MKKTLLNAIAFAAFSLLTAVLAHGQPFNVRDNARQKIRQIRIEYQRPRQPFRPALGNFYIPSDTERLRFIVDLNAHPRSRVKARVELRQVCPVLLNGDIEVSRELLLFALNAPLAGRNHNEVTSMSRVFHLEIQTDPPEGIRSPVARPHCQGNIDHLGEGPYQALIFTGDAPAETTTLLDGNETLNLNYTQEFESVTPLRFERLQLIPERNLTIPEGNMTPRSRGRRGVRRRG